MVAILAAALPAGLGWLPIVPVLLVIALGIADVVRGRTAGGHDESRRGLHEKG